MVVVKSDVRVQIVRLPCRVEFGITSWRFVDSDYLGEEEVKEKGRPAALQAK